MTKLNNMAICAAFSVPFVFDEISYLGNTFPLIVFNRGAHLTVTDTVPFEHEFFARIACSFPSLKYLDVYSSQPQSSIPIEFNGNGHQRSSVI